MSPFSISDFLQTEGAPDMVQEQIANPTETPQGAPDARPSTPTYKVQPVVWMFVTLAAAIVGLYFFLDLEG